MAIEVSCKACGKVLKARDEAAGKRTSCPGCGTEMKIPLQSETGYEDDYGDEYAEDDSYGMQADELPDGSSGGDVDRKPCRACGEMIVRTAAKCRFCGEIFDKSLAGSKRIGGQRELNRQTVTDFKSAMKTAGGIWLGIGTLATIAFLALAGFAGNGAGGLVGGEIALLVFVCVIWMVIGAFTLARHMWALWVGLIFSYLSLLGNIVQIVEARAAQGSACGIIILVIALVQAHRAIPLARRIRESGNSVRDV